jgi:NAD(P)-dependent dehydrogenase (short-subunit alcohol dehydrogenase family)
MKILMVLTSHDTLGNTGQKTGFWLEEFAAPYFVFRDAGVQLTLASPKGGQPPLDPKSDLPENQTPAMTRFKQDSMAQKALSQTVKLADVRSEDFDTVTQRTVEEMLKQKSGCVVSITAALADRPIAGENGSISMITKGGLNAATQSLAVEYANDGIRFNAVAPGIVDTQMHRNDSNDLGVQPTMKKATVKDVVDAVLYLAKAGHVSGEILHVDGAAPARRW